MIFSKLRQMRQCLKKNSLEETEGYLIKQVLPHYPYYPRFHRFCSPCRTLIKHVSIYFNELHTYTLIHIILVYNKRMQKTILENIACYIMFHLKSTKYWELKLQECSRHYGKMGCQIFKRGIPN